MVKLKVLRKYIATLRSCSSQHDKQSVPLTLNVTLGKISSTDKFIQTYNNVRCMAIKLKQIVSIFIPMQNTSKLLKFQCTKHALIVSN